MQGEKGGDCPLTAVLLWSRVHHLERREGHIVC